LPAVKALVLTIAACAALLLAACGDGDSTTESDSTAATTEQAESAPAENETTPAEGETKPKVTVPNGAPPKELAIEDLEVGSGAEAKAGDIVAVQYVGVNYGSGKEFEASWDTGEPFSFQLGSSSVIPGWEQGVEGMKVGGRRELTIPPNLAYGPAGSPPAIGPNETLIFVIDLESIE
jgi:peptidylprolyl isomerase